MKYKVKFDYEVNKETNKTTVVERDSQYGLYVYDKAGNEYEIELNNVGELVVRTNDGKLSIQPDCSNTVIVKTV